MKRTILISALFLTLTGFLALSPELLSQTSGTFSFTVTTTSTGGFSPEHLLAIWIENGSASFIKTKIKYSSNSNLDHLATWTTKSGGNVVDAVTGSTLTSHGTVTFLWNGTNVSGTLVPDGGYNVWLEMAWGSSLTTGKTVNSYQFTKGPDIFTSNPANTANFLSMGLTWTPSGTTGVDDAMEGEDVRVFPNPTTGLLKIDFKRSFSGCLVNIVSETGAQVYTERFSETVSGVKTFDLSSLAPGPYYVTLHTPEKDITFMIIRVK